MFLKESDLAKCPEVTVSHDRTYLNRPVTVARFANGVVLNFSGRIKVEDAEERAQLQYLQMLQAGFSEAELIELFQSPSSTHEGGTK